MILTLIALFVVLVGVFCAIIYNARSYAGEGWYGTAVLTLLFGGTCLLFCIGAISFKEVNANSRIVRIESVRETFESARIDENIHPLELAAIQRTVAEKNEWIANAKFWTRHPLTSWFWSEKILAIEPIR